MTKQNGKNDNLSSGAKTGIGVGIAALAAAAAGAYYFYGTKDGTKNRKALKSWAVKAKGEMMEKMENLKEVTQENYEKAASQVMEKYEKMKNVDPQELAALGAELKASWNKISSHLTTQPVKRKAVITVRAKTTKSKTKK